MGVYLTTSYDNMFKCNVIDTNTQCGVFIYEAHNNIFYHNNFINNSNNVVNYGNNTWDNGYPSGGNYWDDYIGVDDFFGKNQNILNPDGIGDSPYPIAETNDEDRYPLMKPYEMTILTVAIKPGLFKFNFQIKNIGNHTAFNIQWNIRINGGFILIGRESSGAVDKPLLPNEESLLSSGLILLGFGPIQITLAIWADNAHRIENTSKGFLFLFFLMITPSVSI
jgi:parallel beta-helix repeat protein